MYYLHLLVLIPTQDFHFHLCIMKLQTLPMFLFIMSKVKAAEYNDHNDHSPNVFDVPVCVTFSPIKFQGDDTIVNTDKSAGRSITIGKIVYSNVKPLMPIVYMCTHFHLPLRRKRTENAVIFFPFVVIFMSLY